MSGPGNTTRIAGLLERIQAGDSEARDELLRESQNRLGRLASKMLDQFPRLRQHGLAETGVVLNDVLMGLHRALGEIQVDSPAGWINLAAQKIRFRLIDLARKYKSDLAMARAGGDEPSAGSSAPGIAVPRMVRGEGVVEQVSAPRGSDRASLTEEDWANFHLAVESLPADELQVFTLRYYGGWNREETAAILGVSEKTVSRRYTSAMGFLSRCLQEELG